MDNNGDSGNDIVNYYDLKIEKRLRDYKYNIRNATDAKDWVVEI